MGDDDVRERNLAAVQRAFAAVSAGDAAGQLENCTDDVVFEFPYADPPGRIEGKEAALAYLTGALAVFEFRLEIGVVHRCVDPDTLVVEYASAGRVTTTGKPYANTYIAVVRFRDGRIWHQREYYNPVPAGRALAED